MKTGDEHAGDQAAALGVGGRLLKQLEIQAVRERLVLWGGRGLARRSRGAQRTPLLVRFHPLWWIRKPATKLKEAARRAARDAKAAKRSGQTGNAYGEAAATLAYGRGYGRGYGGRRRDRRGYGGRGRRGGVPGNTRRGSSADGFRTSRLAVQAGRPRRGAVTRVLTTTNECSSAIRVVRLLALVPDPALPLLRVCSSPPRSASFFRSASLTLALSLSGGWRVAQRFPG